MLSTDLISRFYSGEPRLMELLVRHSECVRDKALAILASSGLSGVDRGFVSEAAMLHDIGIVRCDARGILCHGEEPYIRHGLVGAAMLREIDASLEPYARVCERHTGCGLTAEEIRCQGLPLPEEDFLPETVEERLICLADKFFSKSGDLREKPFSKVRAGMARFGFGTVERFDGLCREFMLGLDIENPCR